MGQGSGLPDDKRHPPQFRSEVTAAVNPALKIYIVVIIKYSVTRTKTHHHHYHQCLNHQGRIATASVVHKGLGLCKGLS